MADRKRYEYEFLGDIVIADVAFKASAASLNELFEAAATALFESMVDTEGVKAEVEKSFELEGGDVESLLYDFLSYLIYLKDTERS